MDGSWMVRTVMPQLMHVFRSGNAVRSFSIASSSVVLSVVRGTSTVALCAVTASE